MTRPQILVALDEDWQRVSAASAERLDDWARREPALAGVPDLPAVLLRVRADPDATLAALLRLGADGDPVAFTVVLQAMLGKAVLLTAGRPDLLAEAVSELWLAIVEYPLARRPRCIAANLAWSLQRRLHRPAPVPALLPAAPADDDPDATATLAQARRLGLIDELTHRTLWTVYVAGLSSAQAALALNTTPELVRWRCSRALRRLRTRAELLAA